MDSTGDTVVIQELTPAREDWNTSDEQLWRVWSALATWHQQHAEWPAFDARVREHLAALCDELKPLFGQRDDFERFLVKLLGVAFDA